MLTRSRRRCQLREANEEILLPLSPSSDLLHLATLAAFTSRTLLHVIPVVYLLLSPNTPQILGGLVASPDEVAHIFHLPLRAFLGQEPPTQEEPTATPPARAPSTRRATRRSAPALAQEEALPAPGTEELEYSWEDFDWLDSRPYRMHSFVHRDPRVTPSWVSGLTADILIAVALIGYHALSAEEEPLEGRPIEAGGDEKGGVGGRWRTTYQRWADGQMSWTELDKAAREAREIWGAKGRGLGDKRTSAT